MYDTPILAAETPAADIFFGSAFVAIGLVFVVFRPRMSEDYPRLFSQLPGWSRFGPTFLVVFGLLVAGLGVVDIVMGSVSDDSEADTLDEGRPSTASTSPCRRPPGRPESGEANVEGECSYHVTFAVPNVTPGTTLSS